MHQRPHLRRVVQYSRLECFRRRRCAALYTSQYIQYSTLHYLVSLLTRKHALPTPTTLHYSTLVLLLLLGSIRTPGPTPDSPTFPPPSLNVHRGVYLAGQGSMLGPPAHLPLTHRAHVGSCRTSASMSSAPCPVPRCAALNWTVAQRTALTRTLPKEGDGL